MLHEL
jgi:hypothetical protein